MPEFRAGADCYGISRFQSEHACPEWGGWKIFPDSSLLAALLPAASTCMELTLPAKPPSLISQEETQRPGGAVDCRLEISGDRAAHFTANSDSEGAPAGREEPFTASPLPNAVVSLCQMQNHWRQHSPVSGALSPARAVEILVSFLAPVCGGTLEMQLEAAVTGEEILAPSLSSDAFSAMGAVEWG